MVNSEKRKKKGQALTAAFLIAFAAGMAVFVLPTLLLDPLFHFHGPLAGVSYQLNDERYQNNGITRNFDYQAMITGTSMTENFKTSDVEKLYGLSAIKVPYPGGSYKEISDNIRVGLENNPDLQLVIRLTDMEQLVSDGEADYDGIETQGYDYPWYLSDENPFNDVKYLLNQSMFRQRVIPAMVYHAGKNPSTTFDEYAAWDYDSMIDDYVAATLQVYNYNLQPGPETRLTMDQLTEEQENLQRNLVDLAEDYPDTDFVVIIPPYSIYCWGELWLNGYTQWQIDAIEQEMKQLTAVDNIHLYCFYQETDITETKENYLDYNHYYAPINTWMLEQTASGKGRITKENYREYIEWMRDYYGNYDYVALYTPYLPKGGN